MNPSELSEDLIFEYDQIMLAISNVYRSQNIEKDVIMLNRSMIKDITYGLAGEIAILNSGTGLRVTNVLHNSLASSIGLTEQDIILVINGENISGLKLSVLSKRFAQFVYKKKYTLSVQRNGKVLELFDIYEPPILPGFNLSIALSTANFSDELVTKNTSKIGTSFQELLTIEQQSYKHRKNVLERVLRR